MADDVLRLWVLHEEQVVTYRKLSRELKVHVNIAKQAMLDFYEGNKGSCHATFLVTGSKRPSVNNNCSGGSELPELLMKLVPAAELASARQSMDNAASHIYSVERHATNGKHVLATANISAGPIRDMAELSAVSSSVTRISVASISRVPADVNPELPKVSKPEKMAAASASVGSVDSSTKKQSQTDAMTVESPAAKAKDSKSFFGKRIAKPAHEKKQSAGSDTEPAKASVKVENTALTESQADSDVDMDNVEGARLDSKRRIEDMFNDDDDDDDDIFSAPESRFNRETQGTTTTASMDVSDVEMSDLESRVISASDSKADSQDSQVVVDSQPADGSRRMRKRRKVSRVKHTKNARGMLVTQTVDEWESYSESEPEPASRVTTPAKRHSAGDSDTGLSADAKKSLGKGKAKSAAPQRSILTFFGKK
ncbi:hypothetical protein GGI20_000185 [Coemansia sp. BCRC 34301]|nr:hypothetical protein GGI20_000185 [Coemansia sp. BCRC 34301]